MTKRVYILIAALGLCLSAYAGAEIAWRSLRHDFGAFNESEGAATATFVCYNTGDEPLVITGARANCGCTTPRYSADVLAPGDSATLSVTYDPAGRPGRFEKKVYVDTNTEPRRSTLSITGVVIGSPASLSARYPVEAGPMRMARSTFLLGNIDRGHVKSVFESLYNASADTLRPVVTDTPQWLEATVVPAAAGPGEQTSINLFIHSDRIRQWDVVTDTITVSPAKGSPHAVRVPVVVTVREDFTRLTDKERANAPVVRLDKTRLVPVTAGSDGATATITIHNDGRSTMHVRRLYTRTPGVATSLKDGATVKAAKSLAVSVRIPASALGGADAAAVVMSLVTDDPVTPRTTITIPVTTDSH